MKLNQRKFRIIIAVFSVVAILLTFICVSAFATSAGVNADEKVAAAQTAETAQETEEKATEGEGFSKGMGLLAAAIVTSLAGIGGGIAVAAGAPAAIAATSENPRSFGKSIIFVALGESIALYGVVISILILNKI